MGETRKGGTNLIYKDITFETHFILVLQRDIGKKSSIDKRLGFLGMGQTWVGLELT